MKRLALVIVLILTTIAVMGCNRPAMAGVDIPDLIDKLPALNQAVIYSIPDAKFDYASTITLATLLNERIKLDIGYSPKTELLGAISINLLKLGDWVKFPILDKIVIEPFVYAGTRRIENLKEVGEYDFGAGVKLISIKF